MKAGPLRARVVIEQITSVARDAAGGEVPTWGTYATRWGNVLPQTGREFTAAQQLTAELTHLVAVRYASGITARMRARLGTRTLRILAVIDPEERHRELRLLCAEVAN